MVDQNRGQDIAVNELKIRIRTFVQRLLWSLGVGAIAFIVLVCYGPPNMLGNVLRYLWTAVVVRFHADVPMTGGVTHQDAYEYAKYWTLMYRQGPFWALFGGLGLGVATLTYIALTLYFKRAGRREMIDKVTRGAHLSTPALHNVRMRREYRKKAPDIMGRPLHLGVDKVIVPEALQCRHFSFAGAPGTGKSVAISEIIDQAVKRGDKGFVIDVGGIFYSRFGRPQDHVLSLRDPRSEKWDFWEEARHGIPEESMAAALIEEETQGNTYFWKGARAVLASLLRRTSSAKELWEDFKKPTSAIRAKLADADEISRRIMGDNDSDQADGIIGTTVLDFSFLKELNQWAKDDQKAFSITEWMKDQDDSSWTYVLVTANDLEAAKPLLRIWFDIACLAALNRDAESHLNRQTWLILDEVKTLGRLAYLPAILDQGRKYKASVVLGFQSMSQFEEVYGAANCKSILQSTQNKFFFKMGEVDATKYVSALIGEQDVEQTSIGVSFGAGKGADRGSFNRNLVRKDLVTPEEVMALKDLNAFVRLSGHPAFKMRFDITQRPLLQPFAKSERKPEIKVPSKAEAAPQLSQPTTPEPEGSARDAAPVAEEFLQVVAPVAEELPKVSAVPFVGRRVPT